MEFELYLYSGQGVQQIFVYSYILESGQVSFSCENSVALFSFAGAKCRLTQRRLIRKGQR